MLVQALAQAEAMLIAMLEELLAAAYAWRSMLLQVSVVMWFVAAMLGVKAAYMRCVGHRASFAGESGCSIIVDAETYRKVPQGTRLQRCAVMVTNVTRVAATPVVRSVDIQPLPVATRVQRVEAAAHANLTKDASVATCIETSAVLKQRATRKATAVSHCMDQDVPVVMALAEDCGSHMTATSESPATPLLSMSSRCERAVRSTSRPHTFSKSMAGMMVVMCAVAVVTAVAAEAVATSLPSLAGSSGKEWYIVLASIPVLDKVMPLKNLAAELLYRGYRVGFALPENCRHWVSDLDQLEFISLGDIAAAGRAVHAEVGDLEAAGIYESYWETLQYYASFQRPMFGVLLEDLEDDRPDLVVIDRHTFAAFDVCHALSIPYVVNTPSLLLDIDSPPMYVAAPFSNLSMHTHSSLERCLSVFYRLRFRVVMVKLFKEINQVRRDHGLPAIASKDDLLGQHLVLVNSVFGLDEARPITPQFQMVGMLDSTATKPGAAALPEDFERWLKTETLGPPVIFISFQPDVPLSPEFVTTLMNGLETIAARLVWRITLQTQAAFDLRSRARSSVFFLGKNVDEALLLRHAPIALLISPGDFYSIQLALVKGIPTLTIPFSAEQWEVSNAIARAGAGLQMDGRIFSAPAIQEATQALLDNSHFTADSLHLGQILQRGGGAQRAVEQIASVLEAGVTHLLPIKHSQPLYKAFFVDVYLLYGVILCIAAVVLRMVFSVFYSILQIAPDVHLGVTLDDPDDPHATVEVHKTKSL